MAFNNMICRANLAYNVTLYKVTANETYTVCRGGKYYKYKQIVFFEIILNIKCNISLQHLVIKKVMFLF